MARFVKKPVKKTGRTVNPAGGEAFRPQMKMELLMSTMSFMMAGDAYYTTETETTSRINALVESIAKNDPEFILKLAAFARNEMYMRSVPVHLLVRYSMLKMRKPGKAAMWVPYILRRADEPAEAIAHFLSEASINPEVEAKRKKDLEKRGKRYVERETPPIPAFLKKGIGNALSYFDEYQFAKYNREGTVTLKDVVFLCHPRPLALGENREKQQALFDKIVKGELATPDTWETYISMHGSTKENWEHIIPKMGYMALLRNLRNFVQKDVDLDPVIKKLTDPKAVANSKQFPYRFLSASRALGGYGGTKLNAALTKALSLSVANVPEFPGKTAVFSDNSASMTALSSRNSQMSNIEIAGLFSAIAVEKCEDAYVGAFGESFAWVPGITKGSVLSNAKSVAETHVGHSTEGWKAVKALRIEKKHVDRIFVFSDMQLYRTGDKSEHDLWFQIQKYRKEINTDCYLYCFDLAHEGLLKVPESDPLTCTISGWSDKIYVFASMFERGVNVMLSAVDHYSPE